MNRGSGGFGRSPAPTVGLSALLAGRLFVALRGVSTLEKKKPRLKRPRACLVGRGELSQQLALWQMGLSQPRVVSCPEPCLTFFKGWAQPLREQSGRRFSKKILGVPCSQTVPLLRAGEVRRGMPGSRKRLNKAGSTALPPCFTPQ